MAKRTLGLITQESLLATEKLAREQVKAEGSTPQAFNAFIQNSEREGIEYREEHKEEEEEFDTESTADESSGAESGETTGDSQNSDSEEPAFEEMDGDEEPEGGMEPEETESAEKTEAEETNEALDSWIREKTQGSDSAVIRNVGELSAGLAGLGIKYGPGILENLSKGSLWAFSRIGDGVVTAVEKTGEYIEKSRNSIDKLETRLNNAEALIVSQLNAGQSVPPLVYKKVKIINFLKVGSDLNIAGNLRSFASNMTTAVNTIADEVEAGVAAVERLTNSDAKARLTNIEAFMKVDPPRKGFKRGGPGGFQLKSVTNELWSSDPVWPGDVVLVFNRPKNDNNLQYIAAGYKAADMYVSASNASNKTPPPLSGLNATDLIMIAKSAKILIAACRDVTKTQQRMSKLDESYGNIAKRLFYSLADDDAKKSEHNIIANMVHLRTRLATHTFTRGAASVQTHATRVLAAVTHLLEDYAKRMMAQSQS